MEATTRYERSLPESPAADHLENRNLYWPELVEEFRLGFVDDPLPGHKKYEGMLAIPYLRRSENDEGMTVSIRFRCLNDHEHIGHGKYNTVHGDRPRMFNTNSLVNYDDFVCITEGEMDAISLHKVGAPAVGIPGAQAWREYFEPPFWGYKNVYVFTDGDQAGDEFGQTIVERLSNAKLIPCPEGHDVNSWLLSGKGRNAIRSVLNNDGHDFV